MMLCLLFFLRYWLCELGTLNARSLVIEQRSINVGGRICLWRYIWDYYLCNTRKVAMRKKKNAMTNQATQREDLANIIKQIFFSTINNNLILAHCYSFLLRK